MIDLKEIATNVEMGEPGLWFSKYHSRISYPEDANTLCYLLEDASFWFRHRNACILEVMKLFPPRGVLFDIGGGNGYISAAIKKTGEEVALVEPGLSGARNALARGVNPVICSTLEDAGFKEGSLPAVGLFDLIEHIKEDVGFLSTVRTLLAPAGRVYITVPAYNFLWSVDDEYAQHYRRYTLSDLTSKLIRNGFRVTFSTYIFSLLPAPIFFFRTLPSRANIIKKVTVEREAREHRLSGGIMGRLLNALFEFELCLLRRKLKIPFGASCLVVAEKKR